MPKTKWEKPDVLLALVGAAISGLLYALGFVVEGLWPVLAVFVVPFWWGLERVHSRSAALSGAIGFIFGAAAYVAGHVWLLRLVDVFLDGRAGFGLVLWSIYGAWFASGFGFYALIYRALRRRGLGRLVSGIAPWLVLEWLWPLLFPVHCGEPLIEITRLAQIADLGGPLLLGLLVLLINAAVLETGMGLAGRRARPRAAWGAALTAIALSLVYGEIREASLMEKIRSAKSMRVGLIQANLGVLEKRTQAIVSHRRHLEETHLLLAEGPVDLIVWPETAYIRAFRGPLPVSGRLVQQGVDIPLLFGGSLIGSPGSDSTQSNAALLVGRDGVIREAYRKNLLIPLAEWIPFANVFPGLKESFPHAQHFLAAVRTPVLRLDDWRISVPICYESVRPGFVRRMVNEGRPNLLVTLANDAWFGDSNEPRLHLRGARLRAVEHHLFMVRSTNSGISAIVDPLGRILARTGVQERATLRGVVHPLTERTLYSRLGDWPGPVALFVILFAIARATGPDARWGGVSPADRGCRGSDLPPRSTRRCRE